MLLHIDLMGMRTFGTQSAFDVIVVITPGEILRRCIMNFCDLENTGKTIYRHSSPVLKLPRGDSII